MGRTIGTYGVKELLNTLSVRALCSLRLLIHMLDVKMKIPTYALGHLCYTLSNCLGVGV